MPLSFNYLDDEPIGDVSPSFDGGQNSRDRPSILEQTQVDLMLNMDNSTPGRLITRRGTANVGDAREATIQGIAFYASPTTPYLVSVANGYLKTFNPDTLAWDFVGVGTPYQLFNPTFGTVTFSQGVDILWATQFGNPLSYFDTRSSPTVGYLSQMGTLPNRPPLNPKFCAWHTNRLACAGVQSVPDGLYFSQYLDGFTWDQTYWQIRVGGGEGDPITGLISWTNSNLVVFKQHSVWVVNCDPNLITDTTHGSVSTFIINRVTKNVGCVASSTIVQVGADIFFLSDSGVRSLQNTIASDSQDQIGPALSQPVDDIISQINPAWGYRSTAFFWDDRYFLSIPVGLSSVNNYTLVYNTRLRSWSGYWSGWTPTCYTARVAGGVNRLTIGHTTGAVTDWLDYIPLNSEVTTTFQDFGYGINSQIISRGFVFGDEISPKSGLSGGIVLGQGTATVTIDAIVDQATIVNLATIAPVGTPVYQAAFDLQSLGQFRELQFHIYAPSGKMELNRISALVFRDSYTLQT